MAEKPHATRDFLVEEGKKAAARGLIWACLAAVLFVLTPLWSHITAIWRSADELTAVRGDLRDVRADIAAMRREIAQATGEDRVIRQLPGQSYVAEPVRVGEPVVLYLVVQRTRLGAQCRLIESVPLYTDGTGITQAGPSRPAARQIGPDPTRLRLNLTQPPGLLVGRVELYLALQYDCAGVPTPDRTDPVAFNLLEAA
jgi:hypothetical protein